MARLGTPVALDHAFLAVEDAFAGETGRTVALGELGAGRVVAGDVLEAVGMTEPRVPVVVRAIERAAAAGHGVEPIEAALPGAVVALTLEHAADAAVAPGQCLAPVGRLGVASRVETELWILGADDLPGSDPELRRMLAHLGSGLEIELFFHTRPVAASCTSAWMPALGAEYGLTFELAHPVALAAETRFAVRYEDLIVGVGVVSQRQTADCVDP